MRTRTLAVLLCICIGTFVGGMLHILNAEPHDHVEPLDDELMQQMDARTMEWRREANMMRDLADAMERSDMPMRARKAGL